MSAGDVVLVRKCYAAMNSPELVKDKLKWAYVTNENSENTYIEWLNEPITYNCETISYLALRFRDQWEVISPENWPDEVCIWMAKRALQGESE